MDNVDESKIITTQRNFGRHRSRYYIKVCDKRLPEDVREEYRLFDLMIREGYIKRMVVENKVDEGKYDDFRFDGSLLHK